MTAIPTFDPPVDVVREAAARFGTPLYLYDATTLSALAVEVAGFGGPFGFTPRFAIKANPTRAILRLFADAGLSFDASTTHEARRAILAGIAPERIQLTSQMLGEGFEDLVREGVGFTACSLAQLERYGQAFPGTSATLRINPGEGSGHNNRTNVAGPDASFGVWHAHVPDALKLAARHDVRLRGAHHHVGSGGDPARWAEIASVTLDIVRTMPDVTTVNLGGGFKVGRMPGEPSSDLSAAAAAADRLLREFATETGRQLHLEIEPGTYLTATGGAVIGSVQDVVTTGAAGRVFVKLDVGMAEILRPSIYGAQHPIDFLARDPAGELGGARSLLVVGPCCESGDLLTPTKGDPEGLAPRELPLPSLGDLAVVGGAGAYCASMPAKHYNSIPAAPELLVRADGTLELVRRRQSLDDLLRDEL